MLNQRIHLLIGFYAQIVNRSSNLTLISYPSQLCSLAGKTPAKPTTLPFQGQSIPRLHHNAVFDRFRAGFEARWGHDLSNIGVQVFNVL